MSGEGGAGKVSLINCHFHCLDTRVGILQVKSEQDQDTPENKVHSKGTEASGSTLRLGMARDSGRGPTR